MKIDLQIQDEQMKEQELDELKGLRMKKFIAEHPTSRYAKQFVHRKLTRGQLATLESMARRQLKQTAREEKLKEIYTKKEIKQMLREQIILKRLEAIQLRKQRKQQDYINLIKKMYELKQTRTLEEIGAMYGVSRERIRQHLTKGIILGLWESFPGKMSKVPPEPRTCVCGKTYIPVRKQQQYCSASCAGRLRAKYHTPEEKREAVRKRAKWRYYNDPEYRARFNLAQQKRYQKVKHDPKHIEKQKGYSRTYQAKKRMMQFKEII